MTVVRSLEELLALPRDPHVNGFGPRPRIQLAIAGLDARERVRAERSLNRLQARCGCTAAGTTAGALMIAGTAYVYAHVPRLFGWAAIRQLLIVLALSVVAGGAAKLATILFTRVQFDRDCRAQHEILTRRNAEPGTTRDLQAVS